MDGTPIPLKPDEAIVPSSPTESDWDVQRLEVLLSSEHPAIHIPTLEEDEALRVIRETALGARRDLWLWSVSRGVRDGLLAQPVPIADTEHPAAALYYWLGRNEPIIAVMLDLSGHLKDERTLRLLRDLIARFDESGGTLILVDQQDQLPAPVQARCTRLELALPDAHQLEQIVRDTLRQRNEVSYVQVDLTRRGLDTIIRNLRGLSARQARRVILDSVCDDNRLDLSDINTILAQKRRHLQTSGLLDYIQSPVDLSEIGGLHALKDWLLARRDAGTEEAIAYGLTPPRGVLMLGVQGAGKSLSAKAVATAWQQPLLRMDVGALYDKYIGESERRLREALRQAESMSPIILWIDEIEKAFASAASQSTDGGLSKRMFGTLLTWMQEHRSPVFVIATANDIEALPPELLRKGRFDEIFFVDLPSLDARRMIFVIHLTKRRRAAEQFDLEALAVASEGYSGAEIEQSVIAAMHLAFGAREPLRTEHILDALQNSPPLSVTMSESVQRLREWARGRCTPAG